MVKNGKATRSSYKEKFDLLTGETLIADLQFIIRVCWKTKKKNINADRVFQLDGMSGFSDPDRTRDADKY